MTLGAPAASAPVQMASTAYGIVSKALLDAQSTNNVQKVDAGAGAYIIEKRDASGVALVPYAATTSTRTPQRTSSRTALISSVWRRA